MMSTFRLLSFITFLALNACIVSCDSTNDDVSRRRDCVNLCNEQLRRESSDGELKMGQPIGCEAGCQFVRLRKDQSKTPKEACDQYCSDYLNGPSPLDTAVESCKRGCSVLLSERKDGLFENYVAQPLIQIRKVVSRAFGNLRMITSSLVTYVRTPDNKLVAIERSPMTVVAESRPAQDELPAEASGAHFQWMFGVPKFEAEESAPSERAAVVLEVVEEPQGVDAPQVERVERKSAYLLQLLMMLGLVTFLLLGISSFISIVRARRQQLRKAANLKIALQQEPLKLVRPEDLTKLSIMEEEDAAAAAKEKEIALDMSRV